MKDWLAPHNDPVIGRAVLVFGVNSSPRGCPADVAPKASLRQSTPARQAAVIASDMVASVSRVRRETTGTLDEE